MTTPPPEIAARQPWPTGANWEGGAVDRHGNRWAHVPNQGWEMEPGRPYLAPTPNAGKRTRRRFAAWLGRVSAGRIRTRR